MGGFPNTEPFWEKSAAEAPPGNGNRRKWHRNQSGACPAHHCIFSLIHCCLCKDSPSPQNSRRISARRIFFPTNSRATSLFLTSSMKTPRDRAQHSTCLHSHFILCCSAWPKDWSDPGRGKNRDQNQAASQNTYTGCFLNRGAWTTDGKSLLLFEPLIAGF